MDDVTQRVDNSSSGPAMLPEEVLREAQGELQSWHGRGYSIMETSHRSEEFDFMRDFERRHG